MGVRLKFIAALALALLCLTGCPNSAPPREEIKDSLPTLSAAAERETFHRIGLYFDVRKYNMEGFVRAGTFENYVICLSSVGDVLEAVTGGVNGANTEKDYYLLDAGLWRATESSGNVIDFVRKVESYKDVSMNGAILEKIRTNAGFELVSPSVDDSVMVLKETFDYWGREDAQEDLSVLVTDFWDRPSSELAESIRNLAKKNISDGYVFALIGVRAPFKGDLLTGSQGTPRECSQYEISRPFYIVLRGFSESVEKFCQEMRKREWGDDASFAAQVFQSAYYGVDFLSFDGYDSNGESSGLMNWTGASVHAKKRQIYYGHKTIPVQPLPLESAGTEEKPMNVYTFYRGGGEESDAFPFVFSWTIDQARRSSFDEAIAESAPEEIDLQDVRGTHVEAFRIPFESRGVSASLWDSDAQAFQPRSGQTPFRVEGLYYQPGNAGETGKLFAYLQADDSLLSPGLWKFQWQCVPSAWREKTERWENWSCESIQDDWADTDESGNLNPALREALTRTERLMNYVNPMAGQIAESIQQSGQHFLDGVVYLDVE